MLGQDGPITFLRHGSRLIKAHVYRVQPVKSTLPIIPKNEKRDKNIDQVPKEKIQDLHQNRIVIVNGQIITPSNTIKQIKSRS